MPAPSYTYTFSSGATASAAQVNQNFTDILNGVTDGTKDLSISALTCAGAALLNGAVTLGSSTGNDITVTGSLASTIPIKTTNTYNIGSATLGLAGVYFGTGDTDTARIVAAALAASRTYTLPDAGGAADFVMTAGTQTIAGTKTFSTPLLAANVDTATTSVGGVVSTATQVFAGNKGFSGGAYAIDATSVSNTIALAVTDNHTQILTPTGACSFTLPTTSVLAGEEYTVVNLHATFVVTIKASAGATITLLNCGVCKLIALQNTPTTAAHWQVIDIRESGTYTATGVAGTNVTGTPSFAGQWSRNGKVVTVSGSGSVDPSVGSTASVFTLTLPVTSTFSGTNQAGGNMTKDDANAPYLFMGYIRATNAASTVTAHFTPGADVADRSFWAHFTYLIV